ncbi:glycosyltransferase [Promicromonospora thailandica]|uniref:Glycosyltransferase, catalytic subunit of cellulose synthase and poly-beta-1,6-N-acetylglucosamine synthase n=1 Tax=Promicromonospora thailandica TaxID=765201 RepID=A0A9X2GBG8_9MICO|nr:glycosyltransferase family 2 protein [Promicromonospora thailandica]MCP2265401.1 Glycosyltransferase, catalytic subunit of cellulose synthase and poly-beta-1,6-N-acetylglucosamine synthase [Promicromonospora thailandica]BFF16939.1 glycosyltransferase family 2 protein [Promicromonospora thailandica]
MNDVLTAVTVVFGVTILLVGVGRLLIVPCALWFEARHRRLPAGTPPHAGTIFDPPPAAPPSISVIVPAYNEGVVLDACVRSIARSDYPDFEIVCVDDGSTDDTYAQLRALADELPRVRALTQPNAGKGAALNRGVRHARGELLVLVDADGVFRPDTLREMVRAFGDPRVGAVCGDDRTVNLDRVQTRYLALVSHVGTGLVRRALDVLRCLPIVSGNTGAFRRDVLERTGPLREDTVGEDLELTWRVYRAGYRVAFAPRALVHAESPSTLRGLWKQRVRWARGLLQTVGHHRDMVGNPRYGIFGPYLALTVATQVLLPVVQVAAFVVLAVLAALGDTATLPGTLWEVVLFTGLALSVVLLLVAVLLDRSPGDLRHVWTLPLWPFYSAMMSLVMLRAIWLELRRADNRWNKLDRTGTISVDTTAAPPTRRRP